MAAFKSLYGFEGINLILFQSIDPTTSFQCRCPRAVSFVYVTVSVTRSPYRLWHYDRRLHNVHQCFNMYGQLSTNQPSNYIWPSNPSRIMKHYCTFGTWGRSINCHFLITKLTFCYMLISKLGGRGLVRIWGNLGGFVLGWHLGFGFVGVWVFLVLFFL